MIRLVIIFGCLAAGLMAQTKAGGVIQGTVTDDSGTAVTGVFVTAVQQADKGAEPTGPPATANAVSDGSGNYELDNLPGGTYIMCAQLESAGVLNPCVWSDQPVTAKVSDGGTTNGVGITMQRGVIVSIRLSDTSKVLSKNAADDDIMIGTGHGTSPFIAARVTTKDDGVRTYSLLIPTGQPIPISLFSKTFTFGDAGGKALTSAPGGGSGSTLTVTADKGTDQKTVTIQVSAAAVAP